MIEPDTMIGKYTVGACIPKSNNRLAMSNVLMSVSLNDLSENTTSCKEGSCEANE
ncbi:MAG: hypothetical protein ACD_62C00349G0002 [uncultured bacterium]|nr:MAG: hypothetical protein ACD_62C00349G0002 [uncultured bacterium]